MYDQIGTYLHFVLCSTNKHSSLSLLQIIEFSSEYKLAQFCVGTKVQTNVCLKCLKQ